MALSAGDIKAPGSWKSSYNRSMWRCRGGLFRVLGRSFCKNLLRSLKADPALGVVNAALRQGHLATAGAIFFIQLPNDSFLQFRGEGRKIQTGKFGSTLCVGKKYLPGVLYGFDARFHWQSQQGANLQFIERGIPQADVSLHHSSAGVEDEHRGQAVHTAELFLQV